MARVSRRAGLVKQKSVIKSALYARISVDCESESIDNQLCYLREYAKKLGLEVVGEYVDIGKSGTNYRRSGFESMMERIYRGEIKCVVVKDLSRFGRNYIEAGEFIEKIFPLYGVRFIAVDDNYDSDSSMGDNILFNYTIKNLVNEMYARDISKKVSSSIKAKQSRGKAYRSPVIPYGYRLNRGYGESKLIEEEKDKSDTENKRYNGDDRENYIYDIDERVAWVVREIFYKYCSGMNITDITKLLNDKRISPPQEYRKTGQVYSDSKRWVKSSVYRILNNKIYFGVVEKHKTSCSFYSDEKKHITSPDDRLYIYKSVPPIITPSL